MNDITAVGSSAVLGAIRVDKCRDLLMWYVNKVGMTIPLARPEWWSDDVFWCREDAGYLNIIKKYDATICAPNA